MTIFFDSQNPYCKQPFGAVKTGEPVKFCVRCGYHNAEIWIVVRNDAHTFEQRVSLTWQDTDDNGLSSYGGTVTLTVADLYFYRFEIKVDQTLLFGGRNGSSLQIEDWLPEWQLTVYDADFTTPDWVKGGVMYQIFPDRFAKSAEFTRCTAPGERIYRDDWGGIPDSHHNRADYSAKDFFGGSLKGIIENLNRLKLLGVTLLYLNPIFEGPENHRYGTGDYHKVDPWLGNEADFKALCDACEALGIFVILDGVFSHTGADSRYFNRYGNYPEVGAWQSRDSRYYPWYRFFNWPDDYAGWWNFPNLPELAEDNPDYTDYITGENGVLAHWQRLGCKGWRLDVADELPDSFIDRIRTAVKAIDPNAFLIGEVWEDATNKISMGHRRRYLLGRQLDSVMNYPFRNAIVQFALSGEAVQFKEQIFSVLENYPQPAIDTAMNMLSTHDTERILNALGVIIPVQNAEKPGYVLSEKQYQTAKRRLKAAAFLQFTLPGIPSIYYGEEAGLTGFADPFNRGCYPWGQEDVELLAFYVSLSAFRNSRRNDFSSGFTFLTAEKGLFAFYRGNTLCVVNFGVETQTMPAPMDAELLFSGDAQLDGETLVLWPESFSALHVLTDGF